MTTNRDKAIELWTFIPMRAPCDAAQWESAWKPIQEALDAKDEERKAVEAELVQSRAEIERLLAAASGLVLQAHLMCKAASGEEDWVSFADALESFEAVIAPKETR